MKQITAIIPQQRQAGRVNIYLDDAFAFGLAAILAARLKVGQMITPEIIADLQTQDEYEKARETALHLISLRPRSIAEITQHLRTKGVPTDVTAQVVSYLQEISLLDDEAFARYWLEQRETFRPRSSLALRQELQQKGISRAVIQALLSEVDESATARRAAAAKARQLAHLPEEAFRLKLGHFLQQRGFTYDIMQEVITDLWQEIVANKDSGY